jgi:hypothetical protein
MEMIPIVEHRVAQADPARIALPARIEVLVSKILEKKKADSAAEVAAEEAEIDGLVYGLYGLSEGEIAVVEEKPQV